MKEKLPVIYNTVENMYLFAITDIDTQRNLQEFFGRTKITRVQKNGTKTPDVREEEIELIDDNIIKMLEIGHSTEEKTNTQDYSISPTVDTYLNDMYEQMATNNENFTGRTLADDYADMN